MRVDFASIACTYSLIIRLSEVGVKSLAQVFRSEKKIIFLPKSLNSCLPKPYNIVLMDVKEVETRMSSMVEVTSLDK